MRVPSCICVCRYLSSFAYAMPKTSVLHAEARHWLYYFLRLPFSLSLSLLLLLLQLLLLFLLCLLFFVIVVKIVQYVACTFSTRPTPAACRACRCFSCSCADCHFRIMMKLCRFVEYGSHIRAHIYTYVCVLNQVKNYCAAGEALAAKRLNIIVALKNM